MLRRLAISVVMAGGVFCQEPVSEPVSGLGFDAALVKGAPFSAVLTVESVQDLADGNRIERRATGALHRDREGRTRREQPVPAVATGAPRRNAVPMTFIMDPAANVRYVIDGANRMGRKTALAPAGDGGAGTAKETGVGPEAALEQFAGVRWRKEELGEEVIEGARVTGTKLLLTVPARMLGNQQPMEIVWERWYSPELHVYVRTKRTDPRFGTTIVSLTSIVRSDPPAALFEIPEEK